MKKVPVQGFRRTAQYIKRPGDSVGPYLIRCLLGAGMEGHVYKALDLRSGQMCTVKLLRGRSMQSEARHTAAYCRRLAGLEQVKQFREWGVIEHQAGVGVRCWIAFDFVPGIQLPVYLQEQRSVRLGELVLQLLRIVAEVHGRGVAVGDLDHGRNLLVEPLSGRLVLCDADAGVAGAMNRNRRADLAEVAATCRLMYRWRGLPLDPALAWALDRSRSVSQALDRLRGWPRVVTAVTGDNSDRPARGPPP